MEPGITPDQAEQIRERIRARGRKISASPVTVVINDVSTTSTTTEASTTTATTTTTTAATYLPVVEAVQTASEQVVVTTEQPVSVAVANAVSELSIPSGVTEDPSGELSLFPEGAIVLGVSSATEISEVIEIVNFNAE